MIIESTKGFYKILNNLLGSEKFLQMSSESSKAPANKIFKFTKNFYNETTLKLITFPHHVISVLCPFRKTVCKSHS